MNRLIKRYPNRRLYDTGESRYVSLDDLRVLILAGTSFVVQDSKTHEDVTRSVLLQILFDQESHSTPLFTDALIKSFICFYSYPNAVSMIAPYLEKSLELFQQNYQQWTQNLPHDQNKPHIWQEWWQQNTASWFNSLAQSPLTPPWNPWAAWISGLNNTTSSSSEEKTNHPLPPKK